MITVNNSLPGCEKADTEDLSHVCWEEDADTSTVCPTPLASWKWEGNAGFSKGATPFVTKYTVGSNGGTIYFLTKDGSRCVDDGDVGYTAAVSSESGGATGLNAQVTCAPEADSPAKVRTIHSSIVGLCFNSF